MLLAHVCFHNDGDDYSKLCIIPREESCGARPVPIDIMPETNDAVFFISLREAVNVRVDRSKNIKTISPISPALLFLTPDDPMQPGQKAARIQVHYLESGGYDVFFARDQDADYEHWDPQKMR